MLYQLWMTSALCAVALAAPSLAPGAAARPEEMKVLSEYFQMLATKVQAGKNMAMAPVCDLSKAVLPVAGESSPTLHYWIKLTTQDSSHQSTTPI
jgi:hypothetical protein